MLINKHKGVWCKDTTLIDDYAYQLYVNHNPLKIIPATQNTFKSSYYMGFNNPHVVVYYNEAIIILRRYKIERLKNNIRQKER